MADNVIGSIVFAVNNDRCKCNGDGWDMCKRCLRNLAPCGDYQTYSQFHVVSGKCDSFIDTGITDNIVHKLGKTITKRGNKYSIKKVDKDDFRRDFKKRQAEKRNQSR